MKKFLTMLLAIALCFSAVACGSSDGDKGNKTVITVTNYNGGVGTEWLNQAAARFMEENADKSYEEGKVGVFVDIEGTQENRLGGIKTSGYNIFFFERHYDVRTLAQADSLLDITDVLTDSSSADGSIESRIDEAYRPLLKGADGKYYGLPHVTYSPGVSYDKDLFDKYNLYIAAPEETNVENFSRYGGLRLIKNSDGKKSCGLDGVYGTDDDGLPTTLQEFVALCGKMKQYSIKPFIWTGMYKDYPNLLNVAFWASLAGYDQMRANYEFDGEIEIIDGYMSENLIPGINYIKKPITKKVNLTAETGYLVYQEAARYYATAMQEIIYKEGFYSNSCTTGTVSHTDAQGNFIFSGESNNEEIAFLVDGSYWYNEAEEKGNHLSDWQSLPQNRDKVRNIRWMGLPASVDTPIAENNGVKATFIDCGASYCVVNGNIKGKTAVVEACKDFLKFLYSENELNEFSKSTGLKKALVNYTVKDDAKSGLSEFYKSAINNIEGGKLVYQIADNPTCIKNSLSLLNLSYQTPIYRFTMDGKAYINYFTAFEETNGSATTEKLLGITNVTQDAWLSQYYVAE